MGSKQNNSYEDTAEETEGAHGEEFTARSHGLEKNKHEEIRIVFLKTRSLQKRFQIPDYVYSLWCQAA